MRPCVSNLNETIVDNLPPYNLEEDLKKRESDLFQKQRELRQLETKLRKREEDIKLKKAKIKDYEKNSIKMERNMELKNKELECTILTLKTKLNYITVHGEQSVQASTHHVSNKPSSNHSQVKKTLT